MDVLIRWEDGTENVVSSKDLKYKPPLSKKQRVKMKWGKVWWKGSVVDFEESVDDPLIAETATGPISPVIGYDDCEDSDPMDLMPLSELISKARPYDPLTEAESAVAPLTDAESAVAAVAPFTDAESAVAPFTNAESAVAAVAPFTDAESAVAAVAPFTDAESAVAAVAPFTDAESAVAPSNDAESAVAAVAPSNDAESAVAPSNDAESAVPPFNDAVSLMIAATSDIPGGTSLSVADQASLQQDNSTVKSCEHFDCHEEIFAACPNCGCLLCFEHFVNSSPCESHNTYFALYAVDGVGAFMECSDKSDITTTNVEGYEVEEPQIESSLEPEIAQISPKQARNKTVKEQRNKGEGYFTEKTNRYNEGRKTKQRERCNSLVCKVRNLGCNEFSEEERLSIRNNFFAVGNLQAQREWIARHIETEATKTSTRKKRFTRFYLPIRGEGNSPYRQVCKAMFLSTVGVSDRQVRTVLNKLGPCNTLKPDGRGGRQTKLKDKYLREAVEAHINKFPKTESHYCRASTTYQYLSSDLNVNRMYDMYLAESPRVKASLSFYAKVLHDMKLKFHKPKKDLCGICETYCNGSEEDKQRLSSQYTVHIQEKCAVREIKQEKKNQALANPQKFQASVYDLQQVIYLPKSNRGALFYKRRLSCYNFTVYELDSKAGYCFLHHEGIGRRGANEIASNLYKYLSILDKQGKEEVALFSDGCIGQNKNSILPAMLLHFVAQSVSVKQVTLYYFETNHGQSEGDAIHSTIERSLKNSADLFLPCQLTTLIQGARKKPKPYHVTEVQTSDIRDWKALGQAMHILRVRTTTEGHSVDWKKVMQVEVRKNLPQKIMVKFSHLQDKFFTIDVGNNSRRISSGHIGYPAITYTSPPKLTEGKYNDLMSLCNGPTPVISHQDHISFYRNLPH